MRAIVLAAGKGTRLHADRQDMPKALFPICGRPMLEVVLGLIDFIDPRDTYIVVGYRREDVIARFGPVYNYVVQEQQLGTGHAVRVCDEAFRDYNGSVIVIMGDMPMYRREKLRAMCDAHEAGGADCTIMTAVNDELPDWGKIARDSEGRFIGIREAKDCTPEQAATPELFSGTLVFRSKPLFELLPRLSTDNAQGEYYMTELPELMMAAGMRVEMFPVEDGNDIRGVNTPEDLQICERILLERSRAAQKEGSI